MALVYQKGRPWLGQQVVPGEGPRREAIPRRHVTGRGTKFRTKPIQRRPDCCDDGSNDRFFRAL
jgi:hypothetical protein